MHKIKLILVIALLAFSISFATYARIESMGGNSNFIKDEVEVFINPALAFDHGNVLVGSLGKMDLVADKWQQTSQWGGGWLILPVNKLEILVGATMNLDFASMKMVEDLNEKGVFNVSNNGNSSVYSMYDSILDIPEPLAKLNFILGTKVSGIQIAIAGHYAGSKETYTDSATSKVVKKLENSYAGGTFGLAYHLGEHLAEFGVTYDMISLQATKPNTYAISDDISGYSVSTALTSTENYFLNLRLRLLFQVNDKTSLIPVFNVNNASILDITNKELNFGLGINRNIYNGLIWTGVELGSITNDYPDNFNGLSYSGSDLYLYNDNNNEAISFKGLREDITRLKFSFGIERKVIWDWFTIHVGGNKVYDYTKLVLEKDGKEYIRDSKNIDNDKDVVAVGFTLDHKEKLKFDVAVSKEFLHSNILNGEDNGIIASRISATFKF